MREGSRGRRQGRTSEHMFDSRQHLHHCEPLGWWTPLRYREISVCTDQSWSIFSQGGSHNILGHPQVLGVWVLFYLNNNQNPKLSVLWAMPFVHLLLYVETVEQEWRQKGIRQIKVITNQVLTSFEKKKNSVPCITKSIFLGKKPYMLSY